MAKISRAQGPTIEGVPPEEFDEGVPPREFDQGKFFNQGEKLPPEETGDSQATTPAAKPDAKDAARKPARTTRTPGK